MRSETCRGDEIAKEAPRSHIPTHGSIDAQISNHNASINPKADAGPHVTTIKRQPHSQRHAVRPIKNTQRAEDAIATYPKPLPRLGQVTQAHSRATTKVSGRGAVVAHVTNSVHDNY